ncbi:hypothetical protein F01_420970 [Burkholderia cenocepacia]|nr:hypothetical protein F01_420970 [Burkholderia cenocepacia]
MRIRERDLRKSATRRRARGGVSVARLPGLAGHERRRREGREELEQLARRQRHGARADADRHDAVGPRIVQANEAQAHRFAKQRDRALGQDADALPRGDQPAHRLEALHLHAEADRLAEQRRFPDERARQFRAVVERDQIVVEQRAEIDRLAGQRVVVGHDHAGPVHAVGREMDPFGRGARRDDPDVRTAFAQRLQDVGASQFADLQLDVAIALRERAQLIGKILADRRDVREDADAADRAFRIVGQLAVDRIGAQQQVGRVTQQRFAGRREFDARHRAVQQYHAKVMLEQRDAAARGGKRHVRLLRGARQAAQLGCTDEQGEGREIEQARTPVDTAASMSSIDALHGAGRSGANPERPRMVRRTPRRRDHPAAARVARAIGARIRFSGGLCIAPYDGRRGHAFEIFEVPLEGFRISGGRGSR